MTGPTIRVLLVDDQALLRMGFAPDPAAKDPAAHDDAADGSRTVLIDGVAFTNFRLARPLPSGDAAPTP